MAHIWHPPKSEILARPRHLVNISTSVILPVDQLDYYDEKRVEDEIGWINK